ncbi:MAG: Ig-like domain-containing protein, partial [Nonlabens sp.]|nr:Ig-like domain-containing protein [Nonlabens sp.]
MKSFFYRVCVVLFLTLLMVRCAKRGSPTGGPEDKLPPEILKSSTANYQTNFKGQVITLNFDELIKFKDLQKQLIISPPLENKPTIKPQAGVARKITITFKDTLAANTTYTLNFGQSIVDNNEENALPFYKYVFSTGDVIDSLKLSGTVGDALKNKVDPYVNVMLYEINDTYNDSTIYKQVPNYVVNTLDSLTTYNLENLKAGTYKLVALKEKSVDFKFSPKS